MLKKVFMCFVALAAIAAAATGPARAQNANPDVTLDFTYNGWNIPTSGTNHGPADYTSGGNTITLYAANSYKFINNCLLFGQSGSYLQLPAFSSAVDSIVVVGNNGASGNVKQNVYVEVNNEWVAVSTQTTGATGTNTYVINENYRAAGNIYFIKVESAHNTQITYIKVYYTPAAPASGENTFQYCYDCQRSPAYPKTTASASLSGFANPLVGYKGTGFGSNNTSAGPWKLEYMGIWSTTNNYGIDDVSNYQSIYNCTDVPVFRLYQWNATANEYQHAAYGVVCAYAKVSNAIEHTAMFVAEEGWGCVLTNSSHSSSMSITFDEDLTTGLATLITAASGGGSGSENQQVTLATNQGLTSYTSGVVTATFTNGGDNAGANVNYLSPLNISCSGDNVLQSVVLRIGNYSNFASSVNANPGSCEVSGDGNNGSTFVTVTGINQSSVSISCGSNVQIDQVVVNYGPAPTPHTVRFAEGMSGWQVQDVTAATSATAPNVLENVMAGDSLVVTAPAQLPGKVKSVKAVKVAEPAPVALTISKGSTELSGDKVLYYVPGDTYRQALARPENQSTGGLGWGSWESSSLTTIFFKEVSTKAWDVAIDGDPNFASGQGSSTITLDTAIDPTNHTFQFVDSQ